MLAFTKLKPAINLIKKGQVGVFPTDTLYGLIASAFDTAAVERVFNIRQRDKDKPVIVLIGRISDLKKFNIKLDSTIKKTFKRFWPGSVSIILPVRSDQFSHIHRGAHTIAFRLPQNKHLRRFLKKTGPIIAPSANPQGEEPALSIEEAREYFANQVDFYIDCGSLQNPASTVIKIVGEKIEVIREGVVKVN